jgi:hypothetical protein
MKLIGRQFVQVPAALLHDPGLDRNAKLVWIVMAARTTMPRFPGPRYQVARSIVTGHSDPSIYAKRLWVALASRADEQQRVRSLTVPVLAAAADVPAGAVHDAITLLTKSDSLEGFKLEWLS